MRQYAERYGMSQVEIEPALVDAMKAHAWPGNVRELENTVARLLALAPDERLSLALWRSLAEPRAPPPPRTEAIPGPITRCARRVEAFERGDHRPAVRGRAAATRAKPPAAWASPVPR